MAKAAKAAKVAKATMAQCATHRPANALSQELALRKWWEKWRRLGQNCGNGPMMSNGMKVIYGYPPPGVKCNAPRFSYSVVFRLLRVDEHLQRVQLTPS